MRAQHHVSVEDLLPPPFEWCAIPAGHVAIEDHGTFEVAAFHMAKYPITNAQYQVFVDAEDGYCDARSMHKLFGVWPAHAYYWNIQQATGSPFHGGDCPRMHVTWYEAVAFCRWLSARSGETVTLPTEMQWQRAAQGDDGREYPWGNGWRSGVCNTEEAGIGQTTPVIQYSSGASSFGVLDMAGNVWEWCANTYGEPSNSCLGSEAARVLRGGSWRDHQVGARCAFRDWGGLDYRGVDLGFRVCCAFPISEGLSDH